MAMLEYKNDTYADGKRTVGVPTVEIAFVKPVITVSDVEKLMAAVAELTVKEPLKWIVQAFNRGLDLESRSKERALHKPGKLSRAEIALTYIRNDDREALAKVQSLGIKEQIAFLETYYRESPNMPDNQE
jgi:hypothetical protein